MKTTKIFSVLSLVLILSAVSSVFSAPIDTKNNQTAAKPAIRYDVNISISIDKPLCNLWLVKILDGNGRMVAPAQEFISGKTKYTFTERGPVTGTRIAVLLKYQYGDHFVCETELFTAPAILKGTFLNGETYRFDLFPQLSPVKE
jgi:hypothetical protein